MFERRWSEGWAKSKPNGFDKIKHFKTFQNKTNHFRPLEITELDSTLDDETVRAIANSTIITPGCCRKLTPDEIVDILNECK